MRSLDEILKELYGHPDYCAGVVITRDEIAYHIVSTLNWGWDMTITEEELIAVLSDDDWYDLGYFVTGRLESCGDIIDIWPDLDEMENEMSEGFLVRLKRDLQLKKIL